MLALPLAGVAGALHSKGGLVFFGYTLPRLVAPNHDVAESYYELHAALRRTPALAFELYAGLVRSGKVAGRQSLAAAIKLAKNS
jgi:cytochrome b561